MMRDISLEQIRDSIRHSAIILDRTKTSIRVEGVEGIYWPLFFSDSTEKVVGSEIDCCSTSLGIMCFAEIHRDSMTDEQKKTLVNAACTLIWMRNPNGSWPSIVPLDTMQIYSMEGVINDTVMALNALLDIGFLADHLVTDLNYSDAPYGDLNSVRNRVKFIGDSIEWVCKNRVDQGWFYTSSEYIQNEHVISPAILPTANVVMLFRRIIEFANVLEACPFRNKVEQVYAEAIQWLLDVQHRNGGYGKTPDDEPKMAHTAVATLALGSREDDDTLRSISRSLKWVIKNRNRSNSQNIKSEDIFDEYDQIVSVDEKQYRKRVIHHETYLESVVSSCLMETRGLIPKLGLSKYELICSERLLARLIKRIISNQAKKGGVRGAFQSRRGTPGEKYPIYALYYAVQSLGKLEKRPEILKRKISRRIERTHLILGVIIVLLCLGLFVFSPKGAAYAFVFGLLVEAVSMFFPSPVRLRWG